MPEMRKEKKTVAEVVVGKIVKKYRLQRWSEKALGFSRKRRTLCDNEDLSNNATRQTYNRYTDKSLVSKVKTFFTRDDVSQMTTGKKQTITKKKIKMQKRFLVDTMKNLHRKFLAENNTISYASFCWLRPFWVVHPSLSDRDTCQCRLHENLAFLADKLCQHKLIATSNLESLTELVCCDIGSKACMYGECEDCKNRIVPLSSSYNGAQKVTYMQWATEDKAKSNDEESSVTKITVKKTLRAIKRSLQRGSTHTSLSLRGIFSISGNSMPTTVYCAAAWPTMNALSTLTSLRTFLVSTALKFSQYILDHPTNRPHFTQGSSMLVEPKSQPALPPSHCPSTRVQLPYGNI